MKKTPERKSALTIAGSDSGGGAGIQADLKAFASLGVHGLSAITCVTAQNPERVRAIEPCSPELVRQQISAVFEEFRPGAIKTGMLYSKALIKAVGAAIAVHPKVPLVVDPVMVSTSGARLLQSEASSALIRVLLPRATLLTPNLDEAAALSGMKLKTPEDLRVVARRLHETFGCAVLVKGGHLKSLSQAMDIFFDGRTELLLEAPYLRGISTHGTGCTYSAAIAGYLALGCDLILAVQMGKEFITQAIAQHWRVQGHTVLNPFWPE
jgi:hydroxymethylpyrimidine/phosphomethylpyrimidine kinase